MALRIHDPLLTAARAAIMFFMGVFSLAAGALLAALPAVFFYQARIVAELAKDGHAVPPAFIPVVALVMVLVAIMLALFVYFLLLLRRIVNSVGEGDPFVPANADRLARMGWTGVAAQVIAVFVGASGTWVANLAADQPDPTADHGYLSGTGIVLVLTLFVLARVFRMGTQMREELEGTV